MSQGSVSVKKINIIVSIIFILILGISVVLQISMNAHLVKPLKIERVIATIAEYWHLGSENKKRKKE